MNKKDYQKLLDAAWEKFASADAHGYKDLMRRDAFDQACAEVVMKTTEGFLKDIKS